jgi:N-acetylmuramoyl-L-alanine amidase
MRKIFISAGHSNVPGKDRGAAGNGFIEGELTVELRNLLICELHELGITAIVDQNDSILSHSLNFFKNLTTNKDIVLDIHWNAATPQATGTETLVPSDPSDFEMKLAHSISSCISETLNIPMRGNHGGYKGVKTEASSHHGRLGWMRLTGENILMEVCFISNKNDMDSYQKEKENLAKKLAKILFDYANEKYKNTNVNSTYIVVGGDTLSRIASKNNITVQQLKTLNNLNSDVIRVGQVLKIK